MTGSGCRALLGLVLALVLPGGAGAVETVVRNDTAPPGTPCNCFLAGETVAAWLTSPCDGSIVAARVLWQSQIGGAPQQTEMSIAIRAPGSFPTPGAPLLDQGASPAVILGPTLTDQTAVNEFRFLDPPTNAMPLQVPVSSGQTFVVALEYLNQTSGGAPFSPDVVFDGDGCQGSTNAVNVLPGGWSDACPLGVTGDWALRAVVACTDDVPAASPPGRAALALALLLTAALFWGRSLTC